MTPGWVWLLWNKQTPCSYPTPAGPNSRSYALFHLWWSEGVIVDCYWIWWTRLPDLVSGPVSVLLQFHLKRDLTIRSVFRSPFSGFPFALFLQKILSFWLDPKERKDQDWRCFWMKTTDQSLPEKQLLPLVVKQVFLSECLRKFLPLFSGSKPS